MIKDRARPIHGGISVVVPSAQYGDLELRIWEDRTGSLYEIRRVGRERSILRGFIPTVAGGSGNFASFQNQTRRLQNGKSRTKTD